MKRIFSLTLVSFLSTSCLAQQHPGAEEFAARAAAEHGLDQEQVMVLLHDARFKQSIVDAISRPAEAKPWFEYRPIFITDKRIRGGVEFWRENEELVGQAAEEFGVDPAGHRGHHRRGDLLRRHHRRLPGAGCVGHACPSTTRTPAMTVRISSRAN